MCDLAPQPRASAVLARRLLHPGVLDEGLSSGLFLIQGPEAVCWRTFARELVDDLEALNARVLFVDLSRRDVAPAQALQDALRSDMIALDLEMPVAEAAGSNGCSDGTLAAMVEKLVERSCRNLVLIFDQLSRLATSAEVHVLMALKAARDRINLRPEATGRFIIVATDADETALRRYVMDSEQAFFGATVEPLPKA
jgi:hypothetical protein